MLYKESAIAVMVAVMLGAASIFGPLSITSAVAAELLASETIEQGDDENIIIDAVGMDAMKSTSRTDGTLTVKIVQGTDTLSSGKIDLDDVKPSMAPIEVDVNDVNVTGSFDVLVEYQGEGYARVNNIEIIEGTAVADVPDDTEPDAPPQDNEPEEPNEELENIIERKTFTLEDDAPITTVEFDARKSNSRSSGTLTVAIVQGDEVLGTDTFRVRDMKSTFTTMEAEFDNIEVEGDFDVVIMYNGDSWVYVNSISVPDATEPAEDPDGEEPTGGEPIPEGEARLTVNAINQNSEAIPGLWVAVLQGMSLVDSGSTEVTFNLVAGEDYIVEMSNYYDAENDITYEFIEWTDSEQSSRRVIDNMPTTEEFTAKYMVTTGAGGPPPDDDEEEDDDTTTSPPVGDGSGSVTVFAFRMPSEHWGPTFTSANAAMYFVLYNSTADIVYSGFFNENGHTITGLNEGETYWVSPTDCDECHGDPHDVVFDHWDDNTTERQRPVTSGDSVSVYYKYDPDP